MKVDGQTAIVSGGGSGLGLASVRALLDAGARVIVFDVNADAGNEAQAEFGADVAFVEGDVRDPSAVSSAVAAAEGWGGPRILIHTAGVGGPLRIIDKTGEPADLETYRRLIDINLVGTFNVLRIVAASMAKLEPVDNERGVCVLTASIAAYDGRIGQVHYASSKGGVVGMTLPAARDLGSKLIRVTTIAPGIFDTPLLGRLPDNIRAELASDVPHPRRLGTTEEYAALAMHIVNNPMLNGETIRLDGALRMSPR
jgi:NAD(P)-dependent dehydrogenase (short-subunit alcohol dehydrogenase family)